MLSMTFKLKNVQTSPIQLSFKDQT